MVNNCVGAAVILIAACLAVEGAVEHALAQQAGQAGSTHGNKTARAAKAANPLVVDGLLDEAVWREAESASGFLQKDPREGEPASEATEFKVAYTPTVLYIGVIAHDSDPSAILASERRRDGELDNDDSITVVLDSFHDHRNSYRFTTNPLGTQEDALVTDEGNDVNQNWDEKWDVAARITPEGWVAEFAIPFKTVRVPESEAGMVWGLDMQRSIRRKNELTSWTNYRRGFEIASVSQAGHLTGLSGIETGLRLRIKPYLLGGVSHTSNESRSQVCLDADSKPSTSTSATFCDASNVGLEVVKWRITPSLTADFTYRTDFAQTEVDNQQISLDRFPLFFPEKREFFQEGAGIFEFGIAENENGMALTKMFHSRQIGLSPRRFPIPIVTGGRVTGKLLGFGVGLLNVQTEAYAPETILPSNYSVGRIKRDVLRRSNVGMFFLNMEKGGLENYRTVYGSDVTADQAPCLLCPDYNRVWGMDGNFVFYRYFNVLGYFAKSSQPRLPGSQGDNWSTAATVRWNSDTLNIETSWHSVDPKFRDDLGFIPRPDQRTISPQVALRPRIDGDIIRQLIFRYRMDYTMNSNNHLETRIGHSAFEIRFQDGGNFAWVPHTRFDSPPTGFSLRQGLAFIPAGTYSWWNNGLRYSLAPQRRISGQIINWAWHIDYYGDGGSNHDISFDPRIRLTDNASTEVNYGINKIHLPVKFCVNQSNPKGCGFTDHSVNFRLNYNFTNQWLTSTILQYNNADDLWGLNIRLNYIFRPGDDFFLIYTEGLQGPAVYQNGVRVKDISRKHNDRTLQAKLTYSFDF